MCKYYIIFLIKNTAKKKIENANFVFNKIICFKSHIIYGVFNLLSYNVIYEDFFETKYFFLYLKVHQIHVMTYVVASYNQKSRNYFFVFDYSTMKTKF